MEETTASKETRGTIVAKEMTKKPLIIDCIMFGTDFDMLLLHMHELKHVVDLFVVSESEITFQNKPKPLLLLEALERRDPRLGDLIPHIALISMQATTTTTDAPQNPWQNELQQRSNLSTCLHSLRLHNKIDKDRTMVVCCHDADEIPLVKDLEALRKRAAKSPWTGCMRGDFDCYVYSMNWKHRQTWTLPVYLCIPPGGHIHDLALARQRVDDDGKTISVKVADVDTKDEPVGCRGWHLTWFGTEKERVEKLNSFSHKQELDRFIGGARTIPMAVREGLLLNRKLEKLERVERAPEVPQLLAKFLPHSAWCDTFESFGKRVTS